MFFKFCMELILGRIMGLPSSKRKCCLKIWTEWHLSLILLMESGSFYLWSVQMMLHHASYKDSYPLNARQETWPSTLTAEGLKSEHTGHMGQKRLHLNNFRIKVLKGIISYICHGGFRAVQWCVLFVFSFLLLARAEVHQCLLTHSLKTHSAQLQTEGYAKVRL